MKSLGSYKVGNLDTDTHKGEPREKMKAEIKVKKEH